MPVTIDSVQATAIMGRILREHLSFPELQIALGASLRKNGFIGSATNETGLWSSGGSPTVPELCGTECQKGYE